MADNSALRTVAALGVGAFLTYGVMSANTDGGTTINIQNNQHSIINLGGKAGLSEADIQEVLNETPNKKRLANDAILALSPARSDSTAGIEVEGYEELNISPKYISEAPTEVIIPEPEEQTVRYNNVPILIHASDRDKHSAGWAGTVPGLVDRRVKFELSDSVNPAKLHGRTKIKADIQVSSKFNKQQKGFVPYLVEIKKIAK